MVIELRELTMDDLPKIYSMFCDDSVLDNMDVPFHAKDLTFEMEKEWLENELKNYLEEKPSTISFAIVVDCELIGIISTGTINYDENKTKFGYWLGQDYWGKGYGTKAIGLFYNEIKNRFGINKFYASPFEFNKVSQKILEKNGFKKIKKGKYNHKEKGEIKEITYELVL